VVAEEKFERWDGKGALGYPVLDEIVRGFPIPRAVRHSPARIQSRSQFPRVMRCRR